MCDPERDVATRTWRALVGFMLVLALAGCGQPSDGPAVVGIGGDITINVHQETRRLGGVDALIEGTLVVRGGCVLIENELDAAYPVVWPTGTSIASQDPFALELPSGEALTVGQAVSGGGGFYDVSSDQVPADMPEECVPAGGEVAVFNTHAEIEVFDAGPDPEPDSS